jgi:general stress protein YciG
MSVSVNQAGRRGGLVVLNKYGKEFYAEIGRKGQRSLREKHPNKASEWGKRGGRPKKLPL